MTPSFRGSRTATLTLGAAGVTNAAYADDSSSLTSIRHRRRRGRHATFGRGLIATVASYQAFGFRIWRYRIADRARGVRSTVGVFWITEHSRSERVIHRNIRRPYAHP